MVKPGTKYSKALTYYLDRDKKNQRLWLLWYCVGRTLAAVIEQNCTRTVSWPVAITYKAIVVPMKLTNDDKSWTCK